MHTTSYTRSYRNIVSVLLETREYIIEGASAAQHVTQRSKAVDHIEYKYAPTVPQQLCRVSRNAQFNSFSHEYATDY